MSAETVPAAPPPTSTTSNLHGATVPPAPSNATQPPAHLALAHHVSHPSIDDGSQMTVLETVVTQADLSHSSPRGSEIPSLRIAPPPLPLEPVKRKADHGLDALSPHGLVVGSRKRMRTGDLVTATESSGGGGGAGEAGHAGVTASTPSLAIPPSVLPKAPLVPPKTMQVQVPLKPPALVTDLVAHGDPAELGKANAPCVGGPGKKGMGASPGHPTVPMPYIAPGSGFLCAGCEMQFKTKFTSACHFCRRPVHKPADKPEGCPVVYDGTGFFCGMCRGAKESTGLLPPLLNKVALASSAASTRVVWSKAMTVDLIALVAKHPSKTSNKNLKKEGWADLTAMLRGKHPNHPWKQSSCPSRWCWLKDAFMEHCYLSDRLKHPRLDGEAFAACVRRNAQLEHRQPLETDLEFARIADLVDEWAPNMQQILGRVATTGQADIKELVRRTEQKLARRKQANVRHHLGKARSR